MKQVMLNDVDSIVKLSDVHRNRPIFAKRGGKLCGMVVYDYDIGWRVYIGGENGVSGFYDNRRDCMIATSSYGYEFFVED